MENSGVNALQREIKSLQAKIEEYKVEISKTTYYYDQIRAKYDELKLKTDMNMEKPATTDTSSQTEPMTGATFVEQMDWGRVNKRAENYKALYLKVSREYKEVDENFKKMETQYNQNVANWNDLNGRMNVLQWKYDQTKEICNNRLTLLNENKVKITESEKRINELQQNEARLKVELDSVKQSLKQTPDDSVACQQLKSQYNDLKELHSKNIKKCQETANTLDHLKARYGEIVAENESLRQQLTGIRSELDALKEESTRLRQSNEAELNRLNEECARLKQLNTTNGVFKAKYARAKEVCNGRFDRISYLEGELRRNGIRYATFIEEGNENVPNNR